ncbi:hypothetical protein [Microcoleus vaginatus]|uniref:hypothetical protein n=1 Tax=Microcoleus vaginatus TaxID=119532 RepID=UPI0032AACDAE
MRITQTPYLKILANKIGSMDGDTCAKKVEACMQKLPGITEINLVFATLSFGKLNNE